ncbi:MAG: hypothetical protein AB7D51_12735, partial [Desulfovibrionaceae bacterium]
TETAPFFEKYGKGLACEGKFPGYWYTTSDSIHVQLTCYHGENRPFDAIAVSRYPLECGCGPKQIRMPLVVVEEGHVWSTKCGPEPKVPFPQLATEQGLKLGDSYADAVALYGEPEWIARTPEEIASCLPRNWRQEDHGPLSVVDYWANDEELFKILRIIFENDVAILISLEWPFS